MSESKPQNAAGSLCDNVYEKIEKICWNLKICDTFVINYVVECFM